MKRRTSISTIISLSILLTAGIISPTNSIGSQISKNPVTTIGIVVVVAVFCIGIAVATKKETNQNEGKA